MSTLKCININFNILYACIMNKYILKKLFRLKTDIFSLRFWSKIFFEAARRSVNIRPTHYSVPRYPNMVHSFFIIIIIIFFRAKSFQIGVNFAQRLLTLPSHPRGTTPPGYSSQVGYRGMRYIPPCTVHTPVYLRVKKCNLAGRAWALY